MITGASAGIGHACAEIFARAGAKLILCARREDALAQLAYELKDKHDCPTFPLILDVRDKETVAEKIADLPDGWKDIDILINNAGLSRGLNRLHEGDIQDWEEMIDTNIKGLLYISRAIIPGMVMRKSGDVVNISSIAGHELYPGGNVYCATKHAVDALTKGMQIDLVESPVRVMSVDPGLVETEFSVVRFRGDEKRAGKVYQGLTALSGADVAEAVLFCVTRPPHVNINQLRIMPTDQASATVTNRK